MQIAIIVICCLLPCIGMVLGLLLLCKGAKRKKSPRTGGLPGAFMVSSGRLLLILFALELVITLLVLFLAPVTGTRPRLAMTIVMVTLQYATAMILIFVINARMPHDTKKKQGKNE